MADAKRELVDRLQKNILQWEGYRPPPADTGDLVGLGPVEVTFPNGVFPGYDARAAIVDSGCSLDGSAVSEKVIYCGCWRTVGSFIVRLYGRNL